MQIQPNNFNDYIIYFELLPIIVLKNYFKLRIFLILQLNVDESNCRHSRIQQNFGGMVQDLTGVIQYKKQARLI